MVKENMTIIVEELDITNLTNEFKKEFKEIFSNAMINIKHEDTVMIIEKYFDVKVPRKKFNPNVVYKKGDTLYYVSGLSCFKKLLML
ncbi:MAG: hypothetical protein RMJ67_01120 [Elusimicrobiota bacterium]|nr:hypothetical protein [Endomicrobiia bacterium]MDW8165104.1 hypothetical protein [Elusimicrobiota bacterium]